MNRFFEEECDRVDASVFSGDALFDYETREEFKRLLARWSRRIKEFEEMALEEKKEG